jgi:ribosomal protein S18 acetylase RimI-like enzyme
MSDLHVRDAEPGEFADVAALTAAGFDGPRQPTVERVALLRDAEGRARDGRLLVAVDEPDRSLVGTASLLRAGTPYARLAGPREAELRLLAVLPAYRGRGIAYALMQEAIDIAREWDVDALVLDTGPNNINSQRLYHRLGFVRVPHRETHIIPGIGALAVFSHDLGRPGAHQPGIRVRLVTVDEYDQVGALSDAAYSHDYTLPDAYRASLRDVAVRAHEHEVWVAEDTATGELVGTVATPRPGGHISELARDGELDFRLLAVSPTARRLGIGALLTNHVIALARQRGATRVVMNSGPQMIGAHRLYLGLGFVRLPERETFLVNGHPLFAFGLDVLASPASPEGTTAV